MFAISFHGRARGVDLDARRPYAGPGRHWGTRPVSGRYSVGHAI